jgi:hypothetical protein
MVAKWQAGYASGAPKDKTRQRFTALAGLFFYLGWLMGLEPTTTGITILDSTN